MPSLCLKINKTEPLHAYKRYAYKKTTCTSVTFAQSVRVQTRIPWGCWLESKHVTPNFSLLSTLTVLILLVIATLLVEKYIKKIISCMTDENIEKYWNIKCEWQC